METKDLHVMNVAENTLAYKLQEIVSADIVNLCAQQSPDILQQKFRFLLFILKHKINYYEY